ncbi:MAG: methylated-DNA--[protein]-cysteine S-methyltransferase [Chloroflexi bacterium]|nr:methylated-DNA--[protein]-cysteine S-methyltransferase [Chloroflexota bacterium]
MPTSAFSDKVYEIVKMIPRGKVMTYGQVALLLGLPRAARAVGWTLHWVVDDGRIPCQRVVNRYGGLAAGYGWGGQETHRADLEAEGIEVRPDMTVDLERYQWWPSAADLAALQLPPEVLEELNQKLEFSREQLSRSKATLRGRVKRKQTEINP